MILDSCPVLIIQILVISCLTCTFVGSLSLANDRVEELLNHCLDSKHHKAKPGPEDQLHNFCSPWKDKACCTLNTTKEVHKEGGLYNFDFDHCDKPKETNRLGGMSRECRKFFTMDNCFYECEPSIGFWVEKINRSFAKERFRNVPLCAKDCEQWFSACKDDYTCVKNWSTGFNWTSRNGKKVNICPPNSQCRKFKEVYQSAREFCEKVWDNSWKYTSDDVPCMRIWFSGEQGNPNPITALHYIMTSDSHVLTSAISSYFMVGSLLTHYILSGILI